MQLKVKVVSSKGEWVWMSEFVSSEWANEWDGERVSEWISKWASELYAELYIFALDMVALSST